MIRKIQGLEASSGDSADVSDVREVGQCTAQQKTGYIGTEVCMCLLFFQYRQHLVMGWYPHDHIKSWSLPGVLNTLVRWSFYFIFSNGNVTLIYEACGLLTFPVSSPSFVLLLTYALAHSISHAYLFPFSPSAEGFMRLCNNIQMPRVHNITGPSPVSFEWSWQTFRESLKVNLFFAYVHFWISVLGCSISTLIINSFLGYLCMQQSIELTYENTGNLFLVRQTHLRRVSGAFLTSNL